MPGLFDPLTLRGLTLRNRIGMAPMCQYSSVDGSATDWHLVHLGARAAGGAGLVITEATAVTPHGRISPFDLGLWDEAQVAPLARITDFIRSQGCASAIQLAHAGRKASRTPIWGMDGGGRERGLTAAEGAWPPSGPSAIAMAGDDFRTPVPLDAAGIQSILDAFAAAAARADRAGFDVIEVHAAHGYLANSFTSPVANRRDDDYGGGFEGRVRFPRELARAIRSGWPDHKPLFFRLSVTDWVESGWTIGDTVRLAPLLAGDGVDLIDCSSGGIAPAAIPVGPGYQISLARDVRATGIATAAVGLIDSPADAEAIVRDGKADMVLLGRAMLRDPHWPLRAAIALDATAAVRLPIQYGAGWRKAGFHHDPPGVPVAAGQQDKGAGSC